MDLHEIIRNFQKIGYVSIGMGPKHPQGNTELQENINHFLDRYPTIAKDISFVEFLEYYSAAAVDWPDEELTLEIYGFSSDINIDIGSPSEPIVDYKGFLRFAEILVKPGPNGEEAIGGVYAFDITNN